MHYRKYIRDAIIDRLKNGIDDGNGGTYKLDVGGRVYDQRVEPVWNTEYPLCLVYTSEDLIRAASSDRSIYDRVLSVNVDLVHMARTGIEDKLDRLAFQTEQILLIDNVLGLDQVSEVMLGGSNMYNEDVQGEQVRAVCSVSFQIKYWTKYETLGVLDEFLSFGEKITTAELNATSEFDVTIRSK